MVVEVRHGFVNAIPDDPDAELAGETLPSHWNADHVVEGAAAEVHTHAGEEITSGTVADGRVAATLARDSEVATAVTNHEVAGNPHPTYETSVEAQAKVDAHAAAANPHPTYLTTAEGDAAYDAIGAAAAAQAASQPVDSDLTAIAALSTTAYGRALLALADAAAGRTALGLGTAATAATGDFDAAGAAAAAQAASQPLDSDLTAIAALTTTAFGRGLLALADAAALAANHSHGADTDDQTAAEVPFTPAGGIAATDVQAAIEEVAAGVTAREEFDTGIVAVPGTGLNTDLPWTKVDGDDLLDLTDPLFPVVVEAGVYAFNAFVGGDSGFDITQFGWFGLDIDINGGGAFADLSFQLGVTGVNLAVSAHVTTYCPAGAVVEAALRQATGADLALRFQCFVQRIS